MLHQSLEQFRELFREYTELRVQENRQDFVNFMNGNMLYNYLSATGGTSARVYRDGLWGFSSTPSLNAEAARKVVQQATDNARFLAAKESRAHASLPFRAGQIDDIPGTAATRVSRRERIEFLQEVDAYIARTYPRLQSRMVAGDLQETEKNLITADGAHSHMVTPRSFIYLNLGLEKDGVVVNAHDVLGGWGWFEDWFSTPELLHSTIDHLYQQVVDKSEGGYAIAGEHEVILNADLAGVLAHEAIGHTTEYDSVMNGSVAGEHLNEMVASPLVTLVDFAHTYNGKRCPVPVVVDDEGTLAEDTVIIEEGVLRGYMHNKESARISGMRPAGNARASQFSDEPLIRMRNTAILPGKDKLTDMIASVEDGYYLLKHGSGQADFTSEFMFGVILGYEIHHGKLGRAIRDTTISGIAFDMLKTVSMISDDMVWSGSGMCGKKQSIAVGMGGPAIKCRIKVGGK